MNIMVAGTSLGENIERVARQLRTLLLGHPISPRHERHRPFFIIGSGRSGTTLTRAILQSHPAVNIPPETYVLGASIKDFRAHRHLRWSVVVRIVLSRFDYLNEQNNIGISLAPLYCKLVKAPWERRNLAFLIHSVYMHYAAHEKPEATRWGDKTPANTFQLPRIRAVFPDARFIHVLRDGRDVVSSYLKMGRYNTPEEAALRWLRAVNHAKSFGRKWPDQYLELRYEDLVSHPEANIRRLCNFLDLGFDTAMLNHTVSGRGLKDLSRHSHLENARQPIFRGSVGKWRERLTANQILQIRPILQGQLKALGYEDATFPN